MTVTTDQYGQARFGNSVVDLSKNKIIYVVSKDYRLGVLPYDADDKTTYTVRVLAVNAGAPAWYVNKTLNMRIWYCEQ